LESHTYSKILALQNERHKIYFSSSTPYKCPLDLGIHEKPAADPREKVASIYFLSHG
jgi:hypothetical protein